MEEIGSRDGSKAPRRKNETRGLNTRLRELSDWIGWRWENEKNIDKYPSAFLEEHRFLVSDHGLEIVEIISTHSAVVLKDDLAKFLGLQPPVYQRFPARRDLFLPASRRVHVNPEWLILFLRWYSRGDRLLK